MRRSLPDGGLPPGARPVDPRLIGGELGLLAIAIPAQQLAQLARDGRRVAEALVGSLPEQVEPAHQHVGQAHRHFAIRGQPFDRSGQRRGIAGQGDPACAVDAGQVDAPVLGACEPFVDLVGAHGHGAHLALAAGQALVVAAVVDDPDGIGQAQRAAGPGRGHLADAVADHGQGFDAVLAQQGGEADLDGEQCRLGDLGTRQAPVAVASLELGAQREVAVALEEGVHLVHGGGEGRRTDQQLGAHGFPLAAVAGVDEGRALGSLQALAAGQLGGGLLGLGSGEGGEDPGRLLLVLGEQQGAVAMVVAVPMERMGDVVEGGIALGQPVGEPGGHGLEGRLAPGRQAQR